MMLPVLMALYILFPALVIYLCYRFPRINKIGAVVICYISGIILGNIGVLPDAVYPIQETLSEASVVIALPLLLFSMDVRKWSRLAGKTLLSMLLATISIIVVAIAGFFLIKPFVSEAWQLAALSVGVYTGGTPNLAAIKAALNVESTRFIIVHTYDTVISIIYIIFCITIARRVFGILLPPFVKASNNHGRAGDADGLETEQIKAYSGILSRKIVPGLAAALGIALGIVGLSVFLGSLMPKDYSTSFIILSITTLGIGASFIPKIRSIAKTFQFGMYVIYIFCFTVASMANFKTLVNIDVPIMLFIVFSIFGSMALHAVLCAPFKIDTDTFIIVSASAICSPPLVPVVSDGLKNNEVLLSGLTTGIIGYAIGNYLGISIGLALFNFF
ncbi:MAG TPA: DUF819 family protein [Smithellaceae bacterium]|nr:DUF819 family protein [Smithellaceae bacterium]HRS89939.1 DUF819 family protein [Smithellaceae bacterium]HRV26776.1 DUF819 family protein [Smithellaceae bacterium]